MDPDPEIPFVLNQKRSETNSAQETFFPLRTLPSLMVTERRYGEQNQWSRSTDLDGEQGSRTIGQEQVLQPTLERSTPSANKKSLAHSSAASWGMGLSVVENGISDLASGECK